MRLATPLAAVVSVLVLFAAVRAEEPLTKRDSQGPVAVTVTLFAPPVPGGPLKVKVVFDTHSVALDGIAFEKSVALRAPDGTDAAPTAVEQVTGGGHHREAVVVFDAAGIDRPRIVVKNVGGVAERIFTWEPPPSR